MKEHDHVNLAFQITLAYVFSELANSDPKLEAAIKNGFDRAADAAQVMSMQDADTSNAENGLRLLDIVEQLRKITFDEGTATKATLIKPAPLVSEMKKASRTDLLKWCNMDDGTQRAAVTFGGNLAEMVIKPSGDVEMVVWVGAATGFGEKEQREELAQEFADRVGAKAFG